jgi:hypothetical protein
MIGIAPKTGGDAAFDVNKHRTGVGTIKRADRMPDVHMSKNSKGDSDVDFSLFLRLQ